jgi:hypothetical protein
LLFFGAVAVSRGITDYFNIDYTAPFLMRFSTPIGLQLSQY